MLSAGRPGTGTSWTAMHKSPTEMPQNAHWRMATALRLGATPDAGPRPTCAQRKALIGTYVNSLWQRTRATLFAASTGARNRPHRAVQCTLRRLIEQAGGYADMERHVPELYDKVQKNNEAAPEMRCAILEVVSWIPWRPAAALDGRQRAMPARRTSQRKCVEARRGCSRWGSGENEASRYGRASVGLRDLWKTARRRHQVAAIWGGNGGGERAVQPACCRTMEEPVGTGDAGCTSRHILASPGIQGRGATCC